MSWVSGVQLLLWHPDVRNLHRYPVEELLGCVSFVFLICFQMKSRERREIEDKDRASLWLAVAGIQGVNQSGAQAKPGS